MRCRVALLALLVASVAIAQDDVHITPRVRMPSAPKINGDSPLIKVNVDLALVPVVVTDPLGRSVTGLEKGHFQLTYDGKPKEIKYFSEDDAPISIGLILDRSGSMGWKVDEAKAVVRSFAKQVNPDDEIFLITFADTIDSTDFASVTDEIDSRMLFVGSKGRTSLLDAVYLGINKMKDAKYQRRALIIVSDGGDNHSRYTPGEVNRVVEEADVQVFAIGLTNRECMAPGDTCSTEEKQGPYLLEDIARKGGGIALFLDNPTDIEQRIDDIGRILRQEYLLGFNPHTEKVAKYHKLKVKLQRLPKGLPYLKVDAKNGFYGTE